MRSYLILTMCGLFLIQYFVQLPWLENIVIVMTLAAFAGSASKANPMARWFGISMMAVGIAVELSKGTGLAGIRQGISMNLPLLTLVILVPLLSLPLKLGGYFEAIDTLLRRLKHQPRKLFAGITAVLFILGPILNLGSIRVVDEILKKHSLPPMMLAKSYLVGFSTTMLWSPYYASVALVLYYLHIPITEYMAYGIGLALLFVVMGNILFAFWAGRHLRHNDHPETAAAAEMEEDAAQDSGMYRKKLARLGLIVIGLMGITFLLEFATHWSMLVLVSLLALAFPLLWAVSTRGWSRLAPMLVSFRDHSVPFMNNEIVLFTSAGLLGIALQGTAFGNGLKTVLNGLAHQSFFLFALSVVAFIVVVTFIGVHPMATVTTLVTQMNAHDLGTTNIVLAMLLMLSWSISSTVSPVNPLNLLASRLSGTSGLEAGLRANGLHLLLVTGLGLLIITWIH
ncbi:hypothetical protein [Paenibacillus piri]|uniref:Citrate transporter-like domain-containing protein n=1 Tax=Paenibacillus piri TaxID=2547395 RepID=A0A4V2ZU94_9BACL|nr:hypothetical protein [Paenibacillus piri]TDG00115.1 hypothetical protein E1757_00215 [Paenibacillus piri]